VADARFAVGNAVLARAGALAREGRYADAEDLIRSAGPYSESGEALNLLAKIFAQQGRWQEAAECWTRVLGMTPGHQGAAAGLRRLHSLQARAGRRGAVLLPALGWAVAVLLAVALARAIAGPMTNSATDPGDVLPRPAAPNPAADADPPLDVRLPVAGVSVTSSGDRTVVSFEGALFDRGTRLTAGARDRLLELGRQLEPYATSVTLSIVGLTDDLPVGAGNRFRDNATLGMARAAVVFDTLREGGSLPSQIFSLEAGTAPTGGRRSAEIVISRARALQ
jgi:type VI secretion system protein ImpK